MLSAYEKLHYELVRAVQPYLPVQMDPGGQGVLPNE